MKQGKNPTRKQADMITSRKLNYRNWLVIKDTPEMLEIQHRERETIQRLYKAR